MIPPEQVHGNAEGDMQGFPVHQDTLFRVEEVMERKRKEEEGSEKEREETGERADLIPHVVCI